MNKGRGITLIELMVVIVIMGLIASIAAVKILPHRKEEVRVKAAKAEMDIFSISLEMYRLTIGHFPSTSQGLPALVKKPSAESGENLDAWNGPYIKYRRFAVTTGGGCGCKPATVEEPTDPWGNKYVYQRNNDGSCDIISYGKDGVAGGTGWNEDIVRTCIK
ncbi:type II secretion system protein GspG [bacterium]|nr:type II secretion system protein GspG [bacterium]MBU4310742.1 type II secretion system protein GspG [bacterium]MBU4561574.1 type II secretion system protein GspG [bacterium]MCG2676124.1 type II secretion system protein GspG [bacterium]MCG2678134.1 type II secretion system protein GspG [bacterium]